MLPYLAVGGCQSHIKRCALEEDGSITLHYHSSRRGYYPLVKGLLCAAAREIFNQRVEIVKLSSTLEQVERGRDQEHVIFRVTISDTPSDNQIVPVEHHKKVIGGAFPENEINYDLPPVHLNKEQFASAFPYHLIFDEHLRLRQYGRNVARLSPVPLREGMLMTKAFRILYPRISFTVENICRFINAIFIMAVEPEDEETSEFQENPFSMKGQMMWMTETKMMIFIGSPRLMSLKEMKRLNMYMADIPLYDVTREMVLLYQQRNAEIDITKKLDETTAELKRTSRELEVEKQRTEKLLYQMLPEKVATQLKNGQSVEAEKFDQVTVLFSDIVTFTNIAAASSPLEVVNMLNDLYHRFDRKTNEHGVYKVETIGDAYMVVGGVPEVTDQHSQIVANFALDMVEQACQVLSPDTGKPLQVRVGIHTGPVVAGVVGVKMPRYCLFGDTVNTASRMESHSMPGRIHISHFTYSLLKDHGYVCRERGEVNIKGKGIMRTYFLTGYKTCGTESDEHSDEIYKLPENLANGINDEESCNDVPHNIHKNGYVNGTADLTSIYPLDNTRRNSRTSNISSNEIHRKGSNGHLPDARAIYQCHNSARRDSCTDRRYNTHTQHGVTPSSHNGDRVSFCGDNHNSQVNHHQNNISNDSSSSNNTVDSGRFTDSIANINDRYYPPSLKKLRRQSEDNHYNNGYGDQGVDILDTHVERFRFQDMANQIADLNSVGSNGRSQDFPDQSFHHVSVRNRRIDDVAMGRFPLHSKTCQVL